jgi:RHS repeat-associated protein
MYTSGSNRASNAPYTVHHANGQTNVNVDQSQNGGPWALLGNFNLDADSRVVLTNLANSYVIADAIRIGDESNIPEYASVTWPITVPQTGRYKVYGTWNSGSSRASNAKYTIKTGATEYTSLQNQRIDGGQWNLLGEYSFDIADNQNGQNNVSLSAEANGYLIADAIKLELIEENQPAPSGLFFIHNDHLGTPKRLTDTQGQVVWSLQTTPFGEIHEEIANGITLLNGFPGQYRDSETGLSYNYYRDYDPSIGRYVQSDPIGLGGGLNTYAYGYQNPINNFDPDGRLVWFAIPAVPPILEFMGVVAISTGIKYGVDMAVDEVLDRPDRSDYDESSANELHSSYKSYCNNKPPKTGDNCADLRSEIEWYQQCIALRQAWDDGFGDLHGRPIKDLTNGLRKAKKRLKYSTCENKECPPIDGFDL